MLFAEYNRIGNSFNLHNPQSEIIVHTRLKVDEYSSLQNMIVFNEFDERTFFKFQYYGHSVGVVVDGINKFRYLELSRPNAERFFRALKGGDEVLAEFVLLPFYADSTDALAIDNKEYWLMAARIAEFRLWTSRDPEEAELVWFYRSPSYSPVDNEQINDLYVNSSAR
jgi:hypothetical protein